MAVRARLPLFLRPKLLAGTLLFSFFSSSPLPFFFPSSFISFLLFPWLTFFSCSPRFPLFSVGLPPHSLILLLFGFWNDREPLFPSFFSSPYRFFLLVHAATAACSTLSSFACDRTLLSFILFSLLLSTPVAAPLAHGFFFFGRITNGNPSLPRACDGRREIPSPVEIAQGRSPLLFPHAGTSRLNEGKH